jgi:hypothetical protein
MPISFAKRDFVPWAFEKVLLRVVAVRMGQEGIGYVQMVLRKAEGYSRTVPKIPK